MSQRCDLWVKLLGVRLLIGLAVVSFSAIHKSSFRGIPLQEYLSVVFVSPHVLIPNSDLNEDGHRARFYVMLHQGIARFGEFINRRARPSGSQDRFICDELGF